MKKSIDLHGFEVEETGGGCRWLRRGQLAITDGEAGVPSAGNPATVVTLDQNGSWDELIPLMEFPSLEAALAYIDAPAYRKMS